MSARVLIVPAAGAGTRLASRTPKLLVPVAGQPMIDRVLALYTAHVSHAIVVVHPTAEPVVREHFAGGSNIEVIVQERPTGMLDAILLTVGLEAVGVAEHVWITWCDQVAIHRDTIAALARTSGEHPSAAVVLPTVRAPNPYIHLARNGSGRIIGVLQQREGDAMPTTGESDIGLFCLSRAAVTRWLPAYASGVRLGGATGERNFLPFIPWVAAHEPVVTFPSAHPMDALGVNTRDDLRRVEAYLQSDRG